MFPTLANNPGYTAIINERHFARLQGYLADAKERGARIVEINPANEDFSSQNVHRLPPTLVIKPSEGLQDHAGGNLWPPAARAHLPQPERGDRLREQA